MDSQDLYKQEKQKLAGNVIWFTQFFSDLEKLFEKIEKMLSEEFRLPKSSTYNAGSNKRIYMPPYYVLYMGGESIAIQIFMILNPGFMQKDDTVFAVEPSIIVIQYDRGDLFAFVDDITRRIIQNENIESYKVIDGVKSGKLSAGKAKGATFHAFQVPLDLFIDNKNPASVIRSEIIDRLKTLSE